VLKNIVIGIGVEFEIKYAPFGCRRSSEAVGLEEVARGT